MTPFAIGALLFAASLHAIWNLRAKQSHDQQAFLLLAVIVSTVILLPFALLRWHPIPTAAWPIIGISAVFEAAYFLLLGGAYKGGDLSLVYPLSRGSSPLFVTLIATVFLRERITLLGAVGIGLAIVGIYVIHLKSFSVDGLLEPFRALRHRTSQLALLSGFTIAGYSVSDKVGVGYVDPIVYYFITLAASILVLLPYIWLKRRNALWAEWRLNCKSIVGAAVMIVVGYLIILFVLMTSKVSYATSVRGASVVFGALLGTFVLKEALGDKKVLGATIIFAGIICIGLAQ
jgi:drug/metabolite transporter (DMT)-like permease